MDLRIKKWNGQMKFISNQLGKRTDEHSKQNFDRKAKSCIKSCKQLYKNLYKQEQNAELFFIVTFNIVKKKDSLS